MLHEIPASRSRLRGRDGREVELWLGDVAHEIGEQELGRETGDSDRDSRYSVG
jgi:hypothetical protein